MENAKQKAIRLAYGEYWELFSNEEQQEIIKNNGWNIKFNHQLHFEMIKFYEIETLAYGVGTSWRPKSLQGLETNNGWIKIQSEKDLPSEYMEFYYEHKNGVVGVALFNPKIKSFSIFDWSDIVAYQQVIKPKQRIY